MNWAYWNPVTIRFGSGLLDGVAGLIGKRRWALVTYDQPIFRELSARLTAIAGAPVVSVTNIETNPDCADLALSCRQFGAAEMAFEPLFVDPVSALGSAIQDVRARLAG